MIRSIDYILQNGTHPSRRPMLKKLARLLKESDVGIDGVPRNLLDIADAFAKDLKWKVFCSQRELIARVLSLLPRDTEIIPTYGTSSKSFRFELSEAERKLLDANADVSNLEHELRRCFASSGEWPSLRNAFRVALRKRSLHSKGKSIGSAALEIMKDALSPKSMLEVAELMLGGK